MPIRRSSPLPIAFSADHERVEREPERFDDRRHVEHRVRRALERERLRHHLADHDVQIGEDGDGDDAGQGVRRDPPAVPRTAGAEAQSSPRARARRTSRVPGLPPRCRSASWRCSDPAASGSRGSAATRCASRLPCAGLMLDAGAAARRRSRTPRPRTARWRAPAAARWRSESGPRSFASSSSVAAPRVVAITDSSARSATRSTSNS